MSSMNQAYRLLIAAIAAIICTQSVWAQSKKLVSKINGKTYTVTYFDKPIDLALYKKYSKMTFEELVIEAQKNITFYRFNPYWKNAKIQHQIIKTFKESPRYLEPAFKSNQNGKIQYTIEGVFVPKEQINMTTGTDVILINEYGDFHTLLHEMTHYLYNEARESLEMQPQVAASYFMFNDPFFKDYKKFDGNKQKFLSIDHESETLESLMIFAEIKYQKLINFALEEVSVSKLLLLILKDPKNTKRISKKSSMNYAKYKLKESLYDCEFILDKIKIILGNTTPKGKIRNSKKIDKLSKLEQKFVELVALIKDNIQKLDASK
jgi:hypothetical protein